MQVLCTPSEISPDIYCPVCFKGFRLYWERTNAADREARLPDVYDELREHHADFALVAHPEAPFTVPSWSGAPQFSGAALLGGASF